VWTSTPHPKQCILLFKNHLSSRNEHTWGKDLRKMLERNTLIKRAPQRWQDNTEQCVLSKSSFLNFINMIFAGMMWLLPLTMKFMTWCS
jgi:hypothetical protein